VLITINQEDYKIAQKNFKAKEVFYIPGIGIDIEKFQKSDSKRQLKRIELGVKDKDIILISVGELNKNKNHIAGIMAVAQLRNKKLHYVICGQGELKEKLLQKSKMLGIEEQIHLLGYRRDIYEIYKMADIYLHPSYREGLPVALMEAMAIGLPIICSDIRGNRDLLGNGKWLVNQSIKEYEKAIKEVIYSTKVKTELAITYDSKEVEKESRKIYNQI